MATSDGADGTYWLAGFYTVLVVSTIVVPRIAGRSEDGFQASTTAAVTGLGFAALALLTASWLFVRTISRVKRLPRLALVIGLVPLPLSLVGVGMLWVLVRAA